MKIEKLLRHAVDSVLRLAEENNDLGKLEEELSLFQELFVQVPALRQLVFNEEIDSGTKKEIFNKVLEGRFSPYILSLCYFLIDANKLIKLPAVLHYARTQAERRIRRKRVEVISAVEIDDALKKQIEDVVKKFGLENPLFTYRKNPDLIGGVVLRIGDLLVDASVRGRLERFKNSVKARL